MGLNGDNSLAGLSIFKLPKHSELAARNNFISFWLFLIHSRIFRVEINVDLIVSSGYLKEKPTLD